MKKQLTASKDTPNSKEKEVVEELDEEEVEGIGMENFPLSSSVDGI